MLQSGKWISGSYTHNSRLVGSVDGGHLLGGQQKAEPFEVFVLIQHEGVQAPRALGGRSHQLHIRGPEPFEERGELSDAGPAIIISASE